MNNTANKKSAAKFPRLATCSSLLILAALASGQARAQYTPMPSPSRGINLGAGDQIDLSSISIRHADAIGGDLIYNVNTDTSTTATLPPGFTSIAYQLTGNPTLTLSSASALAVTLGLAGTGSVIYNGNINTTDAPAIQSQPFLTANGNSTAPNALMVTNNGTLSVTQNSPYYWTGAEGAVMLGTGDVLVNNGTITVAQNPGGLFIGLAAVVGGQSITNTGTISGTGYGGISTGVDAQNAQITISNSGTISSDQVGIYVANNKGGTTVTNSGTISGAQQAISIVGNAAVTNSGTISSSAGTALYASSGQVINLAGGTISGASDAINLGNGTISNAGTINGNVNINSALSGSLFPNFNPGVYIANGGTLNGNLSFTSYGNNQLIETGSGYGVTGTIDGGPGNNYVGHLRDKSATVTLGSVLPNGFSQEFVVASGASTVVTVQEPANSSANINVGGDGQIVNQANTTGIIHTVDAALGPRMDASTPLPSLTNQANVGGIDARANTLINSGTVGFTGGAGSVVQQIFDGTLSFTNSGTIQANMTPSGGYYGNPDVSIFGSLKSDGRVANSGTIGGVLWVSFEPGMSASGTTPSLAITNSGAIISSYPYGASHTLAVDVDTLINNGYPFSPVSTVSLTNSGTIAGDIYLNTTNNTVNDTPTGKIIGDIHLNDAPNSGSSTNSLTIAGAFAGNIFAGAGTTSLNVSGGSAAAPVVFGALTNIASYGQTDGYVVISGAANLGGVTINGGRLTGLVGSTINAPLITVGAGGSFASGGTVNGNILVNGTLHAGASPDTLTVNGNVSLAAGSTSTFEVSPTAASKLVTSGTVTIAPGATLQIAELQPIMPGTTLPLISAGGGVSGSFSNLTGAAGKLNQTSGDVSLLVLFDAASLAGNPQVLRSITYVNNVLAGGKAPAALMAALPSLTSASGAPLAQAFARTTPEPYASAMQIGVESALTLAATARDLSADPAMRSGHLFAFGQGLGDWQGMDASAARGTSGAKVNGSGFLGGLGINMGPLSVAAYGGYLQQTQNLANLAASTMADGYVGAITARLGVGRSIVTLSAIHDGATAKTTRQTADQMQTGAGYGLHSMTLDGEAATSVALGKKWIARPHLGATWVWTQRAATSETSGSVFALNVAGNDHTAGFVDGGLRFEAAEISTSRFNRFLDLGLRWQLQGLSTQALGGFADQPTELLARGVRRSPLNLLASAGGTYRATEAVSVFISGSGQAMRSGNSANITGGVRVRF